MISVVIYVPESLKGYCQDAQYTFTKLMYSSTKVTITVTVVSAVLQQSLPPPSHNEIKPWLHHSLSYYYCWFHSVCIQLRVASRVYNIILYTLGSIDILCLYQQIFSKNICIQRLVNAHSKKGGLSILQYVYLLLIIQFHTLSIQYYRTWILKACSIEYNKLEHFIVIVRDLLVMSM